MVHWRHQTVGGRLFSACSPIPVPSHWLSISPRSGSRSVRCPSAPDPRRFPGIDPALLHSMQQETMCSSTTSFEPADRSGICSSPIRRSWMNDWPVTTGGPGRTRGGTAPIDRSGSTTRHLRTREHSHGHVESIRPHRSSGENGSSCCLTTHHRHRRRASMHCRRWLMTRPNLYNRTLARHTGSDVQSMSRGWIHWVSPWRPTM